jgi:hypothetical protein
VSWQAVDAVLDARFPDMPPGPSRRYGVGHHALQLTAVAVAAGARPGLRRLAARTSSTIDSVKNALDALVELRAIVLVAASDGRRPDEYRVDLAVLAAGFAAPVARGSARTQRTRPARALARGSARTQRAGGPAPDIPYVQRSSEAPPLRLVAETPPLEAKQRVAAILADAAEHAMNPDLFGHRYRDHLVDERVGALLEQAGEP